VIYPTIRHKKATIYSGSKTLYAKISYISSMDLEARKLSIIDWVLHLKDESALKQLENLYIKKSVQAQVISNNEMHLRHLKSVKDIESGNFSSHEDVKLRFGS
jgi:hypothetical protein